jgi:hypothetical protein
VWGSHGMFVFFGFNLLCFMLSGVHYLSCFGYWIVCVSVLVLFICCALDIGLCVSVLVWFICWLSLLILYMCGAFPACLSFHVSLWCPWCLLLFHIYVLCLILGWVSCAAIVVSDCLCKCMWLMLFYCVACQCFVFLGLGVLCYSYHTCCYIVSFFIMFISFSLFHWNWIDV